MKKLFLVAAISFFLAACNDNSEADTGITIDSSNNLPDPGASSDHTNVKPDTAVINPDITTGDTNMRKDNPGTGSGQSGSATGANNSGSAKDDAKGNK